jgi:two-component system LytT family response regulator
MINAILIDDEINALDTLQIELNAYCPDVEIIAKCQSGKEGLVKIKQLNPDLVFLDIEMSWMNGFEMLQQLEEITFDVIFVTAYDEFAIKAFDFSAIDYLLKPVSKDKLIRAVDKVLTRSINKLPKTQFELLLQNLNFGQQLLPNIALPTPEGMEFVQVKDIIYASAESNYCHIHIVGQRKIFLAKTLKYIQMLLEGHPFLRIHQSYLINLAHVKKYVKGQGGYVVMDNGESLSVSRASKASLMNLIRP